MLIFRLHFSQAFFPVYVDLCPVLFFVIVVLGMIYFNKCRFYLVVQCTFFQRTVLTKERVLIISIGFYGLCPETFKDL